MKKALAIIIALLITASVFSGCTLVDKDDSNAVIAKVNGVPILKSSYYELYNYWYYYLINNYGYTEENAVTYLEEQKESFLTQLINDEIVNQKAEADGYYEYTQEQRDAAQKTADADKKKYVDDVISSLKSTLEGQTLTGKKDGETDDEYFTRIAEEKYAKALADSGYTSESILEEQLKSDAVAKYKEDKLATVEVLEADIVTDYQTKLKEQKEKFVSTSEFINNRSSYSVICYYPEGYSQVQHILISFDEDDTSTLQGLYTSISDYTSEISDVTADLADMTDATEKATAEQQIAQAQAALEKAKTDYDTALKSAQAKIQEKTTEVYDLVKNGDEAAFIKAMIEYTGDTSMNTEEAAKKGMLAGPDDGFVTEFSVAARALENAGDISAPVSTYYGNHIIRKIKNHPNGDVPYDDVKETLKADLLTTEKETQWNKMLETWATELDVKKYASKL